MKKHPSAVRPTGIAAAVAAVLISCATAPALAQSSTADEEKPAGKDEAPTTLQTVRVSATRLESDLLKTPVTVTAVTQEALTREGIRDVRGLSATSTVKDAYTQPGRNFGVSLNLRL